MDLPGFGVAFAVAITVIGAAGANAQQEVPPCRRSDTIPIRWVDVQDESDRVALAMWCDAVGPPVVRVDTTVATVPLDSLLFFSWNANIGSGDLMEVLGRLKSGVFTNGQPVEHFVAFLQEVCRSGPEVPTDYPDVYLPRSKRSIPASGVRRDVVECAQAFGLNIFYVPSMRNGKAGEYLTEEDRGNAILSTLPFFELAAIELPYEKYRRVAIAATLRLQTRQKEHHDVRICCAHFTNRTRLPRFLMSMGVGRLRQARALLDALPERPAVLGGDFNTWALSHVERALPEVRKQFPQPRQLDKKPTSVARFLLDRRVDYILYDVPESWSPGYRRLGDTFGSDHYPLLGWIRLTD